MIKFLTKPSGLIFAVLVIVTIPLSSVFLQEKQQKDNSVAQVETELKKLQDETKIAQEKESNKKALIEFTLTVMDMEPKTKSSLAKRSAIAEKLANFTLKGLPNQDSREQYISMVKLESNFDNTSKSPVGAQGIGQIMPATFNGTMAKLDIGIKSEDIFNEDINLMVGIFYFNELLVQQKGNPRLASIAYNGGSKTAEKFKKLVDINQESANYALKTEHVKETTRATVLSKSE